MAAGLSLTNLSSNWQRLRKILEEEKSREKHLQTAQKSPPEKSLKRKSTTDPQEEARLQVDPSVKRRKIFPNGKAPPKKSLKRKLTSEFQEEAILRANDSVKRRRNVKIGKNLVYGDTRARDSKSQPKMGSYISSLTAGLEAISNAPTATPTATAPLDRDQSSASGVGASAHLTAGKYIALDCEMVGTLSPTPFSVLARKQDRSNPTPEFSIVARVSLTSFDHDTVYDAYVLPPSGVTISDYRTRWSGIIPEHLNHANPITKPRPFTTVQTEVNALLTGRVLVGHAVANDLAVLGLTHPPRNIRDTARYPGYRALAATTGKEGKLGKPKSPALRKLAKDLLGWEIQGDAAAGHSSVEDARTAMELFKREKRGFEEEIARKFGTAAVMGSVKGKGSAEEEQMEDDAADFAGDGASRAKKKKKKKKKRKK